MSPGRAERAIAALRGGRPVRIGDHAFLSVEAGSAAALEMLDPEARAPLLLSGRRAAALGLGNLRDAADPAEPVLVGRQAWLDRETVLALADAGQDFGRGPLGPLTAVACGPRDEARAALKLARLAGLLPALWLIPASEGEGLDAADLDLRPHAEIVARARLPLEDVEGAQIIAFRETGTGEEHVALLIGAFGGEPPLVRLHSECLTGDVFGSLKCDCGPQLREALRLIAAAGGGLLLYLRQEGRGIGLANKLRAYALQDRGLDTVEANARLGFADDERGYESAAAMLAALGIDRVRLLTNNPAKIAGLEAAGITVAERVPHHMPTNPHNAVYVATKKAKSGHLD